MKAVLKVSISGVVAAGKPYTVVDIVDNNIIVDADGLRIGFNYQNADLIPPKGYSKVKLKQPK